MRLFRTILCFSLVAVILTACEQNITVDLGDYEPRLVVHSILQPGKKPRVYLMESRQYFDDRNIEDPYNFVRGATITISDGMTNESLQETQGYNTRNVIEGNFITKDSLLLNFYEADMQIQTGKTYELNVRHDGRELTAFTTVPYPVEIAELYFSLNNDTSFNGSIEREYQIGAYVNDPPDRSNFYQLQYSFSFMQYRFETVDMLLPGQAAYDTVVYIRDNGIYDTAYVIATDSTLLTENTVSNRFSYDDNQNGGRIRVRDNIPYDNFGGSGITIPFKLTVRSVSKEMADYYNSLDDQKDTENNPFAEPVIIKSNVVGGLGLFGSFSKSEPKTVEAVIE